MRAIRRRSIGRRFPAAGLALLALALWQPTEARAQWTTGANINNTNTGNVGVGTPTPGAKLDVGAGAASRGNYTDLLIGRGLDNPQLEFFGPTKSAAVQYDESVGGLVFYTNGPAWGQQPLFLGNGGSVGVGTTSPASQFHVAGSGVGAIRVSGSGGAMMNFKDAAAVANARVYQWRSEGGLFRMALVNDAENGFMRQNILVANSAGNVGIGTASPLQKLQIGGNDGVATSTPDAISLGATYSSQAGYNPKLRVFDNGTSVYGMGVSAGQFDFMAPAGSRYVWSINGTEKLRLDESGNVTVAGNIAAKYQDVAEWVPSTQRLAAATVVVLDAAKTNHVLASTKAYDTAVAGVISESPGVILGEGGEGRLKVATTGRVRVKVDATRAPIKVGDLLVTSDVEGVAMRSAEVDLGGVKIHRPGTIIGKALEPLASGTGEILVLLSLQ